MEIYYAIVNILDYMALHETTTEQRFRLFCLLDKLAEEMVKAKENDSVMEVIESVADANDAGGCTTWLEIVEDFREQHKNGNRVSVVKEKKI